MSVDNRKELGDSRVLGDRSIKVWLSRTIQPSRAGDTIHAEWWFRYGFGYFTSGLAGNNTRITITSFCLPLCRAVPVYYA